MRKITHQKVEGWPYRIRHRINQLTIADPSYSSDAKDCYNNHDLNMNSVQLLIKHEHLYDDKLKFDAEIGEVIISLCNEWCQGEETQQKTYEIGVDSARYMIQTDYNWMEIITKADGFFGQVDEHYYGDHLGMVNIYLTIPEERAMSETTFVKKVLSALAIKEIHPLETIMDKEVDIEIEPINMEEMEMAL